MEMYLCIGLRWRADSTLGERRWFIFRRHGGFSPGMNLDRWFSVPRWLCMIWWRSPSEGNFRRMYRRCSTLLLLLHRIIPSSRRLNCQRLSSHHHWIRTRHAALTPTRRARTSAARTVPSISIDFMTVSSQTTRRRAIAGRIDIPARCGSGSVVGRRRRIISGSSLSNRWRSRRFHEYDRRRIVVLWKVPVEHEVSIAELFLERFLWMQKAFELQSVEDLLQRFEILGRLVDSSHPQSLLYLSVDWYGLLRFGKEIRGIEVAFSLLWRSPWRRRIHASLRSFRLFRPCGSRTSVIYWICCSGIRFVLFDSSIASYHIACGISIGLILFMLKIMVVAIDESVLSQISWSSWFRSGSSKLCFLHHRFRTRMRQLFEPHQPGDNARRPSLLLAIVNGSISRQYGRVCTDLPRVQTSLGIDNRSAVQRKSRRFSELPRRLRPFLEVENGER